MKQYTNKDQTAKLIELGFPKPQGWGNKDISNGMSISLYNDGREAFNYSIGELIEFLCPHLDTTIYRLELQKINECSWDVEVGNVNEDNIDYQLKQELIDALFCTCVTLKEEGVL